MFSIPKRVFNEKSENISFGEKGIEILFFRFFENDKRPSAQLDRSFRQIFSAKICVSIVVIG
jgi:hypothetical protein